MSVVSRPRRTERTVEIQHPGRLSGWVIEHPAAIVALLTALAAALRALHLGARSLNLDEGFSVFLARASTGEFWGFVRHGEFNMLLYYTTLRSVAGGATTEAGFRLLSVLFGVATIPVLYWLGRRLYSAGAGLTAAALFAIHPYAVAVSQVARSYALLVLLAALSSLLFLMLVEAPSWRLSLAYAVAAACAVYSHLFAVLVIAAHIVWLLAVGRRRTSLTVVGAFGFTAVLLVPGLYMLCHATTAPIAWVAPLSLGQIASVLYALTLSRGRCLLFVLLWAIAGWAAVRSDEMGARRNDAFVALWLFLPVAITVGMSMVRPVLVERYLVVSLPASVLLAARGLQYLWERLRPAAVVLALLIALYSASSLRFYFRHPEFDGNWRGVVAYVLNYAAAGDVVVIQPYTRFTYDFYAEQLHPTNGAVRIMDDLPTAAQSPAPNAIWVIGRRSEQARVDEFERSPYKYCAAADPTSMEELRVWKLQPCASDAELFRGAASLQRRRSVSGFVGG